MKETQGLFTGRKVTKREMIRLEADELSLIHPCPGNRLGGKMAMVIKNRAHIADLKRSMTERGFLPEYAIVVHSDGEIVNGHHRYQAALELGIPIWIVIDDTATVWECALADSIHKKWTTMDWICKWAAEGKADYVSTLSFFEKSGVKLNVGLMLLSGAASTPAKQIHGLIAKGGWQVSRANIDQAWKRLLALEMVSRAAFPKDPDMYRGDHIFAATLLHCMNEVPGYDNNKMADRASRQTERIRPQRNRKETARMLEEVYNYGVASDRRLKFDL